MDALQGIGIGAGIGAVIGGVYAANPGSVPSALDIGKTLSNPTVWGIIALYYVLSVALLWMFFKPQTTEQIFSVVTGGVLWGTF